MEQLIGPDAATAGAAVEYIPASAWPIAISVTAAAIAWGGYWYWDTARGMVATWRGSDTYAHGFLVLPVCAWLIWRQRSELARVAPRRDLRVLPLLVLTGIAWLLGEFAGARVIQQFGLVVMIALLSWTLLGAQVARRLAFPLTFLLFAVPVGDFLMPWLMERTAEFTGVALRLSGVPVYREGLQISVPTGNWSIVEACSGLRYLIACFTGGVLYAYLRYRSLRRRLAFVAAAAIVPIVANWFRAYLIVMLAQWSDGKMAADVDHVLYGWVFFGIVTLLLFGIGSLWSEDAQEPRTHVAAVPPPRSRTSSPGAFVSAALASGAAIALWPAAAWHLDTVPVTAPRPLAVPEAGGWQSREGRLGDWRPHFPASVSLERTYANGETRVGLHLAYYRDQRHGPELVSSLNRLVSGTDGWRVLSDGTAAVGPGQPAAIVSEVEGRSGRYLVWRWYWVDGASTASPYAATLLQLRSRLRGRGDDGAMVILYTPIDDRRTAAARALQDFAAAALPGITWTLDHARSH